MLKGFVLVFTILSCYSIFAQNDEAKSALQIINHISWVVSRITTYNDPIVLEEEYYALNVDALKLDAIKDIETIRTIQQIIDVITQLRINEGDRALLQEIYEQDIANALYECLPSPSAIISPNLIAVAINLAQSSASSYANYKKTMHQLRMRLKKETWELDKDKMRTLSELQKELLLHHWTLVQRYGIKDELRVTSKEISQLVERLKDDDDASIYDFLKLNESKYAQFPAYWYYRGIYAIECNNDNDASHSLDYYQRVYYKLLRQDKMAASVAMNKVALLLKKNAWFSKSDILKQLNIIESNATQDDWNLYYFCAMVYYNKLDDYNEAQRVLSIAVNNLEAKHKTRLIDYKNLFAGKNDNITVRDIPNADALVLCRNTLFSFSQQEKKTKEIANILSELCKIDNAISLELLLYYGKVDLEIIFEQLKQYIRPIYIEHTARWCREDDLNVAIPYQWFLLNEITPIMKLYSKEGTLVATLKEEENSRVILNDKFVNVVFKYEVDRFIKEQISRIDVEIPHKYCAITVRFDSSDIATKKDNKWFLSYNRLLAKDAVFEGTVLSIDPMEKTAFEKAMEKAKNMLELLFL
jgi:hypothetical protein